MSAAKFPLGRLVATPGALAAVPADQMLAAVRRHRVGDWGQMTVHDWEANELALTEGCRLLSVYRTHAGLKFWIITEADRSSTVVLLPEDY
ncbi:MAG: hypothetical protein EBS05_27605 [Proteobacteria bacterium]|nr:hypothetical protein [Pseudomonadota bacterium]